MKIMKKIVILISTIFLTIALIIGYRIYYKKVAIEQAAKENKSYESFYNKEIFLFTNEKYKTYTQYSL